MSKETVLLDLKAQAQNAINSGLIPNADDQVNLIKSFEFALYCLDSTGDAFNNVQPKPPGGKPTGALRPTGWRP